MNWKFLVFSISCPIDCKLHFILYGSLAVWNILNVQKMGSVLERGFSIREVHDQSAILKKL